MLQVCCGEMVRVWASQIPARVAAALLWRAAQPGFPLDDSLDEDKETE